MADNDSSDHPQPPANDPRESGGQIAPHQNQAPSDPPEITAARAFNKLSNSQGLQEITAMMGTMGPMAHPLHQKMNEEHITKMLDLAVQHDTNEFTLRKNQQELDSKNHHEQRWAHTIYFVLFVALLLVILIVYRDQPTVLLPILTGVGGAISGFAGGFGYAKFNESKKGNGE